MTLGDILKTQTTESVCTGEKVVEATKNLIGFEDPFIWIPSAEDRDIKIPIFSDSVVTTFRLTLSNTGEYDGCVLQMTPLERKLWYDFVDYQTARGSETPNNGGFEGDDLLVLQTLNNCIENELGCIDETYVNRCFNLQHTWEDCTVSTEGA